MNKRKAKKIGEWLNYMIGFTGRGPTLLDRKPSRELGRKEKVIVEKLIKLIKKEQDFRRNVFRMSCIEVLGEDPDTDWS